MIPGLPRGAQLSSQDAIMNSGSMASVPDFANDYFINCW